MNSTSIGKLVDTVAVFKALSDENRLRILWLLNHHGTDICVCQIMAVLELPQHEASKHLKQLLEAGLITRKKTGRFVFYKIVQSENPFIDSIITTVDSLDPALFENEISRCSRLCDKVLAEAAKAQGELTNVP